MKKILIGLISGFFLTVLSQQALAEWQTTPDVFNAVYYADQNSDVEHVDGYDKQKLTEHWKNTGIKEGRRSSPVLDVRYYLKHNPGLQKQFGKHGYAKAAYHWHTNGIKEGRPSHPDFNVKAYLKDNPDIARQLGEHNYEAAVRHYLNNGYREGRKAN